jgi:putative PIN family toxin of toxin-antitoxin system
VRAVIDTNVVVSGLLWLGTPHRVLEQVRGGRLAIVTSPYLLAELTAVLGKPKFRSILLRSGITDTQLVEGFRAISELVDPPLLEHPVSRDPKDDPVLALAQWAGVEAVITGDDDLLSLASFAGIPMLDPSTALAQLTAE